MLYPLLQVCRQPALSGTYKVACTVSVSQALDEEYLKVDAQFGGVDQRKIFTFAEKVCHLYFIVS